MAALSIGSTMTVPWVAGSGNIILTYVGENVFEVSSDSAATTGRSQKLTFTTLKDSSCTATLEVVQLKGSADVIINCEDAVSTAKTIYNSGSASDFTGPVYNGGAADSSYPTE